MRLSQQLLLKIVMSTVHCRALYFYKHFDCFENPSKNVRLDFDWADLGLEADVLTLRASLWFELILPLLRGRNPHQLFFGLNEARTISPGGSPFPKR